MHTVGVDWAAGHWVTVRCGDEVQVSTEPSILNVWHEHHDADRILVDIPIGLPSDTTETQDGRRACDIAARNELPPELASSVFPVPCRDAVEADDYEAASEANRAQLDSGLSAQSWGIVPRIREVDVFLRTHENARDKLEESHPEVCFAGLADDTEYSASKLTDDGESQRKNVLGSHGRGEALLDAYEEAVETAADGTWKRRITTTRTDDVLDAMALALTAQLETRTLPADPPHDDEELPMQIVAPA
jgi:predicted RNase H-like nuclease